MASSEFGVVRGLDYNLFNSDETKRLETARLAKIIVEQKIVAE